MIGPILKGEKAFLKTIEVSQAKQYLGWLKNKKVNQYLSTDGEGLTLKKETEYIKKARKKKNKINWSIYTLNGRHIGSTGLDPIDIYGKKTRWGIFIGEVDMWGQGIGTDVLKTVLKYCFQNLKLQRIELEVASENLGAIKCYKRCGFKKEGVRKRTGRKGNKYYDMVIMAILKEEYNKL